MLFISFQFFRSSSLLCLSVSGSPAATKTALAPRWNLRHKRPAAGCPLATAQHFAFEKEIQRCNRGLALWTAESSRSPPLSHERIFSCG